MSILVTPRTVADVDADERATRQVTWAARATMVAPLVISAGLLLLAARWAGLW